MTRPKLLDLFCGGGGAAMGYHRAGFDVVGVDIAPQPRYPFTFYQADAFAALNLFMGWNGVGRPFDAVHASPPCQAYTTGGRAARDGRHPDLLPAVREGLLNTGLPWVIENVPGAPMRTDVMLCGSMFGLPLRRHRLFELGLTQPNLVVLTPPCLHGEPIAGVYGNPHGRAGAWPGMLPSDLPTWSRAMGIDWMTAGEIVDAIPPAYTEFIGSQLLASLRVLVSDTETPL